MGLLGWLFGASTKKSRRTTKKLNRNARVQFNQRSVSLTVGGKRNRVTVGRKGVRAKVLGLKVV